MNNTSWIVLKSIGELIKSELKSVVPSYQRGYRWEGDKHVSALLNDLYDFYKNSGAKAQYYFLQPLVIKN